MNSIRKTTDREIAIALLIEFAESSMTFFALAGYYDNDADFIYRVSQRLNVEDNKPYRNKLTRVVRHLVRVGVLNGEMWCCHKADLCEPTKQMEYKFNSPGKKTLLTSDDAEWEADFLLRYAYPKPQQLEE